MDDQRILRAGIACARLVTLLALLIPVSASAASFDPYFQSSFTSPDTIADWAITSGNWQFVNEEFVNSSAGALSIATVPTYQMNSKGDVPDTLGGDFSLDVYALIVSSASDARVGWYSKQ